MKHKTKFLLCISLLGHVTIAQTQEVVKDYEDKIMKPFKKNHFLSVFSILLLSLLISCKPTLYLTEGSRSGNSVKTSGGSFLYSDTDVNIIPKTDRNYYIQFIKEHPHSRLTTIAREELEKIDWANSNSEGTIQAYQTYLKEHPSGKKTNIAKTKIILLNDFSRATQYYSLEEWIKEMNNSKINYKEIYNSREYNNQIKPFKDKISNFLLEGNCNITIIMGSLLDCEGKKSNDEPSLDFKQILINIALSSIGCEKDLYNLCNRNKQSQYSIVIEYREYICCREESLPGKGSNWGSTTNLKDVPCAEFQISLKGNNRQIANIKRKDIAPIIIDKSAKKYKFIVNLYDAAGNKTSVGDRDDPYSARDYIFDKNGWRLMERLSYSPFIFEVSK